MMAMMKSGGSEYRNGGKEVKWGRRDRARQSKRYVK
jgi:hypothetical protein